MAWQMPLRNALLPSNLKIASEILPIARGIEKEAPSVATNQRVELFAREHQPVGIRGLGNARINVRFRKMMHAHLRTTQTKEIIRSRGDATTGFEVIADAFRKLHRHSFSCSIQQQVEPF